MEGRECTITKKPPLQNRGSRRAPVRGLEPRTRGLTVRCSNQLSYTGKTISNADQKFTDIFIFI